MTSFLVRIHTSRIRDWETFHDVFSEALGFPSFYGRTMNAWIDCLSSLDDPGAGMATVNAPPGGVLTVHLDDVDDFAARCPELYAAVIEGSAFVNWRRSESGLAAVVALSFCKTP